jgi:hypothetical protein
VLLFLTHAVVCVCLQHEGHDYRLYSSGYGYAFFPLDQSINQPTNLLMSLTLSLYGSQLAAAAATAAILRPGSPKGTTRPPRCVSCAVPCAPSNAHFLLVYERWQILLKTQRVVDRVDSRAELQPGGHQSLPGPRARVAAYSHGTCPARNDDKSFKDCYDQLRSRLTTPTSTSLWQVSYLKQEENVAGIGLILTFISKGMSRHPTSFWTLSPERRLV